jgi:hypothetical protein
MNSEQRLDRLERIARLFVRAGLRARRNMQAQDEKINIIINNQMAYDQRFAGLNQSLERSHNELSQSLDRSHKELSQSLNELAKAQTHTSKRLDSLIEIVRRDRNGNSN